MITDFIKSSAQSQRYWAARFGISESYLSSLMSGRKSPSIEVAALIERETGGAVPMRSFVTLPPVESDQTAWDAAQ